jgi:hypothetical protein
VPLAGLGVSAGPNATVSAVGVDFGTQLVGTMSPVQEFYVTNYGAASLSFFSVAASSGPFTLLNTGCQTTPNVSMGSGSGCYVDVTFTPDVSGPVTGTISISDDAAGSPQIVSLNGKGAMMTPLLTGYCHACNANGSQGQVAQCPAGQMSKTPTTAAAACPNGPADVSVDLDRTCSLPISAKFKARGYCVTE